MVKCSNNNKGLDYLFGIDIGEELDEANEEELPNTNLFQITMVPKELYDVAKLISIDTYPIEMNFNDKQPLLRKYVPFNLIEISLYKKGHDEVLQRVVYEHEQEKILKQANEGITKGNNYGDSID